MEVGGERVGVEGQCILGAVSGTPASVRNSFSANTFVAICGMCSLLIGRLHWDVHRT
jgi:hypothetical protein